MSILVTRYLKRSELVQALFDEVHEDWQLEHKDARFAWDVEELCGECLELTVLCNHVRDTLRSNLETTGSTQEIGRAFQGALVRSLSVMKGVLDLCEAADQNGYPIKGHTRLADELATLTGMVASFEKEWPFFRKDMMDAARSAYLRGDFRTAEDLLNDPQDNRLSSSLVAG